MDLSSKAFKLLKKYQKGECSLNEKEELFDMLNQEDADQLVTPFLFHQWNEVSDKIEIDSNSLLSNIKAQMSQTSNGLFIRSKDEKGRRVMMPMIALLKYASVVVVTVLLTIFFSGKFRENPWISGKDINEINVPLGSKTSVVLTDGSQVWLNSGSKLRYGSFIKERYLFLEGEAYFKVSKNDKLPFIVKTSNIEIKALGTAFNVKSYPEENYLETTLVSGSLSIKGKERYVRAEILLKPGQKALIYKGQEQKQVESKVVERKIPSVKKVEMISPVIIETGVNTLMLTSWKEDKLIFNSERFDSLAIRLERWYDVDITLEPALDNYRFTGSFEKNSIDQVLTAINLTAPVDFRIDSNKIVLSYQKKQSIKSHH